VNASHTEKMTSDNVKANKQPKDGKMSLVRGQAAGWLHVWTSDVGYSCGHHPSTRRSHDLRRLLRDPAPHVRLHDDHGLHSYHEPTYDTACIYRAANDRLWRLCPTVFRILLCLVSLRLAKTQCGWYNWRYIILPRPHFNVRCATVKAEIYRAL